MTLLIINPPQFTPEFIYAITYLYRLFSAEGWIWSPERWSSRYHPIKLILIIEGSH